MEYKLCFISMLRIGSLQPPLIIPIFWWRCCFGGGGVLVEGVQLHIMRASSVCHGTVLAMKGLNHFQQHAKDDIISLTPLVVMLDRMVGFPRIFHSNKSLKTTAWIHRSCIVCLAKDCHTTAIVRIVWGVLQTVSLQDVRHEVYWVNQVLLTSQEKIPQNAYHKKHQEILYSTEQPKIFWK